MMVEKRLAKDLKYGDRVWVEGEDKIGVSIKDANYGELYVTIDTTVKDFAVYPHHKCIVFTGTCAFSGFEDHPWVWMLPEWFKPDRGFRWGRRDGSHYTYLGFGDWVENDLVPIKIGDQAVGKAHIGKSRYDEHVVVYYNHGIYTLSSLEEVCKKAWEKFLATGENDLDLWRSL